MSLTNDLTDMLTPVIENAGFRLWDLKVTKAGKRSIVSITLDKHNGATVDDIAEMSKLVAPLLDDHASLDDAYHLEVATPGLERSLTRPEHFQWSLGMNITVSHRADGSLVRNHGKLTTVSDSDIGIENAENETITIPIESITKAHTLFDFEEAMKKGSIESQTATQDELQGELA